MALQSSGVISLNDIAGEFGGTTPHALNEYYGVAAGIPTSGLIGLADFYGASAGPDYSNVYTHSGGDTGVQITPSYGTYAANRKVFAVTVTRSSSTTQQTTYLRNVSSTGTIRSSVLKQTFAQGGGFHTSVNLLDITGWANLGSKTTDTLYLTGNWSFSNVVYFFTIYTNRATSSTYSWGIANEGTSPVSTNAFPDSTYRSASIETILIACSSNTGGVNNPRIDVVGNPYGNNYIENTTSSNEWWLEHSGLLPGAWISNYTYSCTSSASTTSVFALGISFV